MVRQANTVSVEYTGNKVFAADPQRTSLFIVMLGGAGTIAYGEGGAPIPIQSENWHEAHITSTAKLTITSSGKFVMLAPKSTHDKLV